MDHKSRIRILRFSPVQRLFHILLVISFLVQSATGVGRMFIETGFGRLLCYIFGGYGMARVVHIYVGIFMILGFGVHAVYLMFKVDWRRFPGSLFSEDSIVPRPSDIKGFFSHMQWMFGRRSFPPFDRWGFWEKFDYWAVFWGMVIIGSTGLIMAFPVQSSRYIPGWFLNVAFWIHRIEAILAMGHVFIIHFFIAHLRRHNFPMDRAMFEGSVSIESARHERAAWIQRLEKEGRLRTLMVEDAHPIRRAVYYVVGYSAMFIGLFLLFGGLLNSPDITW